MNPERWRRIEEAYHAARSREAAERAAYLDEIGKQDEDLRREVESLLDHDDSSPDLPLNGPAWLSFGGDGHTAPKPKRGTRFGPYEIEAALGAGGMGEVFRARDMRLDRLVAIKLLGAQFSDRSLREARAISALNHPHICTLFDVGPDFLVMELLEGENLASRLKKGPLPMDVVCQFGLQIASAMAAAHSKGIIHRDLKPANIMVTKAGVKVLDFGLARGPNDETLTIAVMGTPAYMAPEQKEGKRCDARTDIYAFGLILREMAAGKRGNTASDAEPLLFAKLVDRCIKEDPEERWQSASDLVNLLELMRGQPAVLSSPRPLPKKRRASRMLWAIAGAALFLALAAILWKSSPRPGAAPPLSRLVLTLPSAGLDSDPGQLNGPPAISPDGKIVVLALSSKGLANLWMRPLDSDRFERLDGTGGGTQPFWSPDSKQIAFFADGKLKKMRVPHGTPEILCETATESARGGAWSSKGIILFGVNYMGLMKIREDGGDPVLLSGLDTALKENSLRFPHFLADGNRFIYFSRTLDPRNHAVYLDALDTAGRIPRRRLAVADGPSTLGHDPSSGRDFLVFPKDGQLWAQRLDEASGSLAGEKQAISDEAGQFSLSATGTLVSRKAASEQNTLSWLDRAGRPIGQVGQPGDYWDISLSPDGHYAAVMNHRSREGRFWVETIDLRRNLQNPISDPTSRAAGLVWSQDSGSIYFTSWGEKQTQVLVRRVDSTEPPRAVITSPERYDVRSLAADDRTLAADHWTGATQQGLGFAPGGRLPWRVFEIPNVSFNRVQFSHDGKWLLYQSNESGRYEIYAADFPALRIRRRLSISGGAEPRWGPGGKEIFYVAPGGLLISVAIRDPVNLTLASPQTLFHLPGQINPGGGFSYDVSRDGRFLALNTTPPENGRDLVVILNWPQLISGPH